MTRITQFFYRNGQIREAIPMRSGQRHGVSRVWHKNGVLASEEPYRNGLVHGVCRQWNQAGQLLGKYKILRGTGLQRNWHENGRLQMEVSTVNGEFCGRNRIWLWDGTLLSERFYIYGKEVGADRYQEATGKDKALPRFRADASVPLKGANRGKRIFRTFIASLKERGPNVEGRKWFRKKSSDSTHRSLGPFKRELDAAHFVERLHIAGATRVKVLEVYKNAAGDEFADSLLVHLPKQPRDRRAIRKVCIQSRRRGLAVQPEHDIGEACLYLFFG